MAEISTIGSRKGPKSSIFGVPDLENFFWQTFDIKTLTHQKLCSGPSSSMFYGPPYKKSFLHLVFQISAVICPESNLMHLKSQVSAVICPKKLKSDTKIWERLFRKRTVKCRWGGSRTNCLVCESFYIESLSKKISRLGPQKSTILGLFRNRWSKFLPSGKKRVFWDLDFFEKSRKWGVIFGGAPPKFFLKFGRM